MRTPAASFSLHMERLGVPRAALASPLAFIPPSSLVALRQLHATLTPSRALRRCTRLPLGRPRPHLSLPDKAGPAPAPAAKTHSHPAMKASPPLRVQLLHPGAVAPTRGSAAAAGYDLSASASGVVPARGRALLQTGLAISLPCDVYGRIAPRSGLSWKKGLDVGAGVIDADYRGELRVLLFNMTDDDVKSTFLCFLSLLCYLF